MKQVDNIYLDHAAATYLLPEVKDHISKWLNEQIVNPSSIHGKGRLAANVLDKTRQDIASIINCKSSEIIFTSGGTEANNLAVEGIAQSLKDQGRHIITCRTEHPSILESCKQLEQAGFEVTYLPTDAYGQIDLDQLQASITPQTILITLMWVNNETGLIHPIQAIANIAQEHGIKLHCDAAQAVGHIPIQLDKIAVDALTFSAHKIGAPSGCGVLYLRKGTQLQKQHQGGDQENNQRAGTQNMLGASAFSKALRYHHDHFDTHDKHFRQLVQYLQKRLLTISGAQINQGNTEYSPHIINCSFHNVDGEALFIRLDNKNISVSNGAACSSGSQSPSHVLIALGLEDSLAQASLRISLGLETSQQELDVFCDELETIIQTIQKESS